jgi:phosphoglycerate dehydrogenase-like enzyme
VVADPDANEIHAFSSLRAVLPRYDIVVLACPQTAETKGLADRSFFAALKPGATFVNIARGGLVQDAALIEGLDNGTPGTAILDVFEPEPLPPESPLWSHPRVRVSSHNAGLGDQVVPRGDTLFLHNLEAYAAGRTMKNEVPSPA